MRRKAICVRPAMGADVFAVDREAFHAEASCAMRVFQHRRAHAVFADNGLEPRQCYVQS